jgi:hypothetical protein
VQIARSRVREWGWGGEARDYERRAKPVGEALEPVSGEGNKMEL